MAYALESLLLTRLRRVFLSRRLRYIQNSGNFEKGGLVLTPTHGCIANIFSRAAKRRWTAKEHFYFALGAMLPDLPLIAVGLPEWIKYLLHHPLALTRSQILKSLVNFLLKNENPPSIEAVRTTIGYYRTALFLDQVLHMVLVWLAVLFIAYCVPRFAHVLRPLVWGAILVHIMIDWPTHTFYRRAYFWPFFPHGVSGFISHENPTLIAIEACCIVFWVLSAAFSLGLWWARRKKS